MIPEGQEAMSDQPHRVLVPTAALVLTAIALNPIALNPSRDAARTSWGVR